MTDPIYVVSQAEIYHGDEALSKLRANNDSFYADEHGSVLNVPDDRWQKAQVYERETWLKYNSAATDDRNRDHLTGFGGYTSLPSSVGSVVEVGCGVFTNLRLLLQYHTADKVTLLDPLVEVYKTHPNCTYAAGTLAGYEVTCVERVLEGWKPRPKFDTLVMINVLHHCKDAEAALIAVRGALKSGSTLVFHELPREIDTHTHYDEGHPLSPSVAYLNAFLSEFDEVYRNGWYFIGTKR